MFCTVNNKRFRNCAVNSQIKASIFDIGHLLNCNRYQGRQHILNNGRVSPNSLLSCGESCSYLRIDSMNLKCVV